MLKTPDFTQPFVLHCDASSVGLGSVLTQEVDGVERPVAFHLRLQTPERNYSTTERELLAVVDSINHFRAHLYRGHKVYCYNRSYEFIMVKIIE